MSTWQLQNVHSPTGSVDSGLGLSPRSLTYGGCDEITCSQIFGDGGCSESPTCGVANGPVVGETELQFSATQPDYGLTYQNQLTQEEIDSLSCSVADCSDCSSLAPPIEQPSRRHLTEIGRFDLHLTGKAVSYQQRGISQLCNETPSSCGKPESTVNDDTIRRKRRLKARQSTYQEAHPGIDPCLVPKSGTAKPRQSRKKQKLSSPGPMAGKKGSMRQFQPPHMGARVKETARERLNKLREKRQREQGTDVQTSQNVAHPQQHSGPEVQAEVARQSVVQGQSRFRTTFGSADTAGTGQRPPYSHSVEQILHSGPHHLQFTEPRGLGRRGSIEHVLLGALQREGMYELVQYLQQADSSTSDSGETLFHTIVNKLNQNIDRISPQQIKQVMKVVCGILSGINTTNLKGECPLYQAALYGNLGAVEALVEANADPWIQEKSAGETALHAAIRSKSYHTVFCIISSPKVRSRERINIAANNGNTPLHNATALRDINPQIQKDIVLELLSAGADPTRKNHMNQMAHSLLPDALKELQVEMRRRNGRRRQSHVQKLNPDSPPEYVSAAPAPRYPPLPSNIFKPYSSGLNCGGPIPIRQFQHPRRPFQGVNQTYATPLEVLPTAACLPPPTPARYPYPIASDPTLHSPIPDTSEYSDSLDELLDKWSTED